MCEHQPEQMPPEAGREQKPRNGLLRGETLKGDLVRSPASHRTRSERPAPSLQGCRGRLKGGCRCSSGHDSPGGYGGCAFSGAGAGRRALMKRLMPETPDIFPVALLCVFPARALFFVKALWTDKKGEFKSGLNSLYK